jgi:hypothetical protein
MSAYRQRESDDADPMMILLFLVVGLMIGFFGVALHEWIPADQISCSIKLRVRSLVRWICLSCSCPWCVPALLMERDVWEELRKVKEQSDFLKVQNDLLIRRLDALESNRLPSEDAACESVKFTEQKVDLALSQIISLENEFLSLHKKYSPNQLPRQLTVEPHDTVSHAACPITFPDQGEASGGTV